MFSDTTGEHEQVETTHRRRHRGDALAQAMHVHVKAKRCIGVTVGTPGKDVAHVAALCQACEAGMTLEPFGDLAGVEPAVREEPQQQSGVDRPGARSEEHTSELQSLMRSSYAVFCLNKKTITKYNNRRTY